MADCLYYIDVKGEKVPMTEEELIKHLAEPDETGISPFDQFVQDKTLDLSQIKEKYAIQVRRPKKEVPRPVGAGENIPEGGEGVRPSKQRVEATEKVEGDEETIRMRSLYRQLINRSTALTPEQKSILENDPNALYTTLPVAQTKKFALDLIKGLGVENAVLEATKRSNGLEPVERTMILGAAMDYYSQLAREQAQAGNLLGSQKAASNEIDANEKLQQIASELGQLGTAYGRAINIFKEIYKLSNIALVQKLKAKVEEINEARAKDATSQAKNIVNIIKDEKPAIKEAANDLTETQLTIETGKISELEKQISQLKKDIAERDKAAKGTKKNPLKISRFTNDTEYDKRLKDFMQRSRSIISKDDIADLTYFGLYHIENGVTKFADWYNVMSNKFKGFKGELKNIYQSVREKAIENGASQELFDTDVDSILAGLQEESDADKLVQKSNELLAAKIQKEDENDPAKARILAPRFAAEKIRKDAESTLDTGATEKEQTYLKRLVKVVNQKAREYYAEKKENIKNVNDILAFAIANNKEDDAIWERTQAELYNEIMDDESLTDEKRSELLDFLDNYINSTFETLLTKTQVKDVVKEKLIEAGYFKEKTINGKVVKAVDWSKITGNANTINEAKENITKAILDLGFTKKEATPEINAILNEFDTKVADIKTKEINNYLNKGVINKIKGALGKQTPKTQISKLIEMNNKGMLSDVRVKDVLAKELGLITLSKEDLGLIQELAVLIDDPNIPYFIKRQFEEQLQYVIDSKGGNIDYLENREYVMANRLSSGYNQLQNATGFFRTISTLLTVAAKTGKPFEAAKVFGKEFLNSLADAKSILLRGRVSRGSSFSDLTRTTEGEPRVRYLEYGKNKLFGGRFLGKPIYAQLGGKKVDLNVLNAAYSKVKYIQRLLEAVDTPSSNVISGLTQFWQINKQVNNFYPELSAKQKSQKVYDIMYGLDREAELPKAINDLKRAGISNPTPSEINRTINERVERARNEQLSKEFYKTIESLKPMAETSLKTSGIENPTSEQIQDEAYRMIGGSQPLDIVARGERQAGRETGKTTTAGITSLLLLPVDMMQNRINQWVRTSKTSAGTTIANSSDAVFSQLFPFVHSIGRWVEMQLELTPYGAIKGVAYKTYAKFAEDGKTKITPEEYNELGDDYILRSILGTGYVVGGMYVIGMLKSLAGDDDEAEDALYGTAKEEKYTQERVKSIGKPKQTVKIGGYNIPLQLLGNTGIVLGMWGDYLSMKKKPENAERSIIYISSMVTMNSVLDATWYSNASKYGGLATSIYKGAEEKYAPGLGRIAGGLLGSQIPFNRGQVEFATLMNPKSQQSTDFGTNVLNQMSIMRSFTEGKPSFDYRGRNYDYGDIYTNSADGLVKMFSKAKYGDEIDAFLSRINFAATDAYRESREADNYNFAILNPDNTKRFMTYDEYYTFKKLTAEKFNESIKKNYKSIDETTDRLPFDDMEKNEIKKELSSILLLDAKQDAFEEVQKATGYFSQGALQKIKDKKAEKQERISALKERYKKD